MTVPFSRTLVFMHACREAREWQAALPADTPEEAYARCEEYEWAQWMAAVLAENQRELLGIACRALRVGFAEIPLDDPAVAAAMEALEREAAGTADLSTDELILVENALKPLRDWLNKEWLASGADTKSDLFTRMSMCEALFGLMIRWNAIKGGFRDGDRKSFRTERFNVAENLFITVEDVAAALAATGKFGGRDFKNWYDYRGMAMLRLVVPVETFVACVRRYERREGLS